MRISSLDRKLLRDLKQIRGQAVAIALVIASGVAMFVLMRSAFESLSVTQRSYYERYRFGDVFVTVERAPAWVVAEIAELPGVARVEPRVVADVTLDVPGREQPPVGRLISVPVPRRDMLCDLYLESGRWPQVGRPDEVLINEAFAAANDLLPGDSVAAVIHGRWQALRIVGIAQSPEYVYVARPGELVSDPGLFAVLWMERRALASAFDMEGGFNDVVLRLAHGASSREVISRLDALLDRYGATGAIERRLQPSHFYLQSELDGLRELASFVPVIFLAVAAFLLNVVLSRIVTVQREQVAALKALGYSDRTLAGHYLKLGLAIAIAGSALGIAGGAWMGRGLTRFYADFFHFPLLEYRLGPHLVAQALVVSLLAAASGTLAAVASAVRLPPAEAMRPEPPARFRRSRLAGAGGLRSWLSQPTRIVLRNLRRRPMRAAIAVVGIAFGGAMYIVGSFTMDSMDEMIEQQFQVAQRQDATITFFEPRSARARFEVARLPGVQLAEPYRAVPARLHFGHRYRNTLITGLAEPARLQRVVDAERGAVQLPAEGLVLSRKLAELLAVERGERLRVEVLVEKRPVREVVVADLVQDHLGTNAYMRRRALNDLLHEGSTLDGAHLQVEASRLGDLYRQIKETPAVAALTLSSAARASFADTLGELFNSIRMVTVPFAVIIAFGVIYNSARITLSERSRELATLRVIGFRRAEITAILLGELTLLSLLAIPLALALGYAMAAAVCSAYDLEVYRLPLVIARRTYASAVLVVVLSTLLSALAVRRRLHRLDLIGVLKTRE